jgi:hypothetical protein
MKTELPTDVHPTEPCRHIRVRIAAPRRPHPAHRTPLSQSIRVRPTRGNREYLKALRAAELAAWERLSTPPPAAAVAEAKPAVRRLLPSASQAEWPWESWLLGLLAGCSAVVLFDTFLAANVMVSHWARLTEAVRALLAAG